MSNKLASFIGPRYAWGGSGGDGARLVNFLSRISVLGLILGVALLIVVLAVMNGFERELRERILSLVPHVSMMNDELIPEWQDLSAELEQHETVLRSAPFLHTQALLGAGRAVEGVLLYSIEPEREYAISALPDFVSRGDAHALQAGSNKILLGKHVARKLGVEPGGRIRVLIPEPGTDISRQVPRLAVMTVAGLIDSGTEMDHSLAFIHLGDGQALLDYGEHVQGIRLQLADVFAAPQTAWELVQSMPPGFYARDWQRSHGNLYHAIQLSRNLVLLMIIMVIAVAVFNVVASLVMVVNDKRGDIAILRTMGADNTSILRIFLVQGVCIGVIGVVLGVLVGLGLCWLLPELLSGIESLIDYKILNSEVYPIDYLPIELRVKDIAVVSAVALAMSLLASLYPAWRALKVQPAEALRWDA